jgi:hypothetical protein
MDKVQKHNSFNLRVGLPSGLFTSGFPTKISYGFLTSLMCTTCPAHLVLLNFMTLVVYGEAHHYADP